MSRLSTMESSSRRAALARLGFIEERSGTHRRDGFTLAIDERWIVMSADGVEGQDVAQRAPAQPGLWRRVDERGGSRMTFEVPTSVASDDRDDLGALDDAVGDGAGDGEDEPDGARDPVCALARWALATAGGAPPVAWTPPARAEVELLLPPARLCVRNGSLLSQGRLVHAPERLALVFPLSLRAPKDLSRARSLWLAECLADAQRTWRMVRFGCAADARTPQAEIDLTGAPGFALQPLLRISIDSLRNAVRWLLPSIALLVDTGADCRALRMHPQRFIPRNHRRPPTW